MSTTNDLNIREIYMKEELIKRIALYILFSLTIIQQMPLIKDLYYSQIRFFLYIVFGLFCLVSLFSITKYFKYHFVKFFLITILYALTINIIFSIFGSNSIDIFELLVPFGVLLCSLNTSFDKRQISKILIWYILLATLLGVISISYYSEGFNITAVYSVPGKNQIGPILGISTLIMGLWIIKKSQFEIRHDYLIFKIGIFTLLITSIIVIRNRASIVAILISLILFLLIEYKFKKTIKSLMTAQLFLLGITVLFLFGTFDSIIDSFWKSLTLNYDITDLNSLSANRTDVYMQAFQFAIQNPIYGEAGNARFIYYTPHNYILNKWVEIGVIGSLPLVLFYLYLWFFAIRGIFVNKVSNQFTFPLWVLLFSLIVSIFEYTYPFGPGVSQIMLWFLLGQYIKTPKEKRNYR